MLTDEFRQAGDRLFRWRSYLPLGFLVLAVPAVRSSASGAEPAAFPLGWDLVALAVAFVGLGVRILTVGFVPAGTSGRNTLKQVASSLNVTGAYSVVRHPIYLGNFLMWLGVSLLPRCWWFTLITVLCFWLYYERIMFAEECFLWERFGEPYRQWAARTPAFIPDFRNWVRPDLPFSLKAVIAREYSTFFAIIGIFTWFSMLRSWYLRGSLMPEGWVAMFFVVGLLTYVTVKKLKKKTSLLRAENR